jgi:GNAT superfamily N-acetyltransferase
MPEGPLEIESVVPSATQSFWNEHARESLRGQYDFTVVWHEQFHDIAATVEGRTVGAVRVRIAASLAHVASIAVDVAHRRTGVGRRLLERAEELSNYYNCHKMTVELAETSPARAFFEACGYHVEAVVPQHTFKREILMLRKFLL